MKKFDFVIEELLQRNVIIEAEDEDEAYEKIQEMYSNEDIVLDEHDFAEFNIELISELEDEE